MVVFILSKYYSSQNLTKQEFFPQCTPIYTGSAKNMYTHFNRRYLCIIFEVELSLQ